MKKIALIKILTLFFLFSFSQNVIQPFEFSKPPSQTSNSLYNSIKLIDIRKDTSQLGVVQLGAFNKKAKVVAVNSLQEQLSHLMQNSIDISAKDGELLLLLRRFNLSETVGGMSEKGFCVLRAILFAKNKSRYEKIDSIDRFVTVASLDVTKELLKQGSGLLSNFVIDNLTKPSSNALFYAYEDLFHFDSIEKAVLPVYQGIYRDGLYKSFQSFANQTPDVESMAVELTKSNNIKSVKTDDQHNEKIKSNEFYALVHKQQPYIITDYGFYPLEKRGSDFYFSGKIKIPANSGDVTAATLMFGLVGGLMASGGSSASYEMRIDHVNGSFIRLKKLSH